MDKLTIAEYDLLMEAVELRLVDEDYRLHRQAYLNFSAQATKKTGNSIRYIRNSKTSTITTRSLRRSSPGISETLAVS